MSNEPSGPDAPDVPDTAGLRDQIDHSFGSGPEHPPTHERVRAGRRALRRRRLAATAGAVAGVIVVVGAGMALTGSRDGRTSEVPVAPAVAGTDDPTSAPPTDSAAPRRQARRAEHRQEQRLVSNQFPAALTPMGDVVVKDGWSITRRVREPAGYQPPEKSLGVVVTDDEHTLWMLLTLDGASADPADKGYSRFEDWLASMVELNGGAATSPLVEVDADGGLAAGPGASLVEVRDAPAVPDYTSAGDRLAQVRRDGRTWFVVVRGQGPDPELIPIDADVLPAPTFAALVTYLTSQADSGEGVR